MKNLPQIEALLEAVVRREVFPVHKDVKALREEAKALAREHADMLGRLESLENREMRLVRVRE